VGSGQGVSVVEGNIHPVIVDTAVLGQTAVFITVGLWLVVRVDVVLCPGGDGVLLSGFAWGVHPQKGRLRNTKKVGFIMDTKSWGTSNILNSKDLYSIFFGFSKPGVEVGFTREGCVLSLFLLPLTYPLPRIYFHY
jgi:hypothetical protein